MATCLAGLDLALVSTAMPTVAAQLGGLELYAWTFSAYLLSSTVAIPIYGKLADVYGRKPTFLLTTGLFVVGSALCAGAQSMPQLIVFRLLQGLGGGGLYPVTLTIVGDAFALELRARVLGLLAAIWGVSAVVGPAVGGFLTEQLNWRWAFLVQLPLALLAMLLIARFLTDEPARVGRARFDALGALLLASAVVLLLLALQTGLYAALIPATLLAVTLVRVERRAREPLLPPRLFHLRPVAAGALTCLVLGVMLFGQDSFVPPLLQGVLGASPTAAGLTLSATSIGWPLAANLCGPLVLRFGYRVVGLLGAALLVAGFLALRRIGPGTELQLAALIQMILGAGFGLLSPVALLSMQNAVEWSERGVVTGINQFATNLGGALGVAVAGALFGTAVQAGVALPDALAPVFWLLLGAAVLALAVTARLPGGQAT